MATQADPAGKPDPGPTEDENPDNEELPEGEGDEGNEGEDDSPLGMSDEEFLKQPPPPEPKIEPDDDDDGGEELPAKDGKVADAPAKPAAKATDPKDPTAKKEIKEPRDPQDQRTPAAKPDANAIPAETKPKEGEQTNAIDYKAEYERLMTPFRANGKDIALTSIDDAIQLMQMGANYSQKMKGLKPNLKLLKMLEGNDLLDETKINYLIDLHQRKPGAINKLLKDGGLDPMDLDPEKAGEYKQSAYKVDDREIELDTVLDELQGSPAYTRTLDIVSTKWDAQSKQTIAGNPQLLRVINDHVDRGIYDVISKKVETERMLGRLNGLTDIEAYRQVGDAIQASGGFNHLGQQQPAPAPSAPAPVVVPPKPRKPDPVELKDRRRAASSTRPAALSSLPQDFNPLALSDDEFIKHAHNKYV